MAWRWPGNKPLSEPIMVWFTDAYVRHSASVSYSAVGVPFFGVSMYVDFF